MTEQISLLIPTVLCGGAGTRLWPLSRDQFPKQLLSLAGSETMLQATIRRINDFVHTNVELASAPMVVCNEDHRFLVAEQINGMDYRNSVIILEPMGRNTAPALTVAALHAIQNINDPLLLVMPADHVIENIYAFHQALSIGIRHALSGAIVTFGIVPDCPETGYGYIHADRSNLNENESYPIIRFVEKPDRKIAEVYLAEGGYYWNSGMFLLRANTWLAVMEQLQPEMLSACTISFERGSRDVDFLRLDREVFSTCPADSIDYAVMEKLTALPDESIQGIVVPLDAGWSDLGAWDVIWKIARKDSRDNNVTGDVVLENVSRSLVLSTSRLVTGVSIDGLVVVETPDAVLVAQMDKAQDVKGIVKALKEKGRNEGAAHRKVHRPWGWYDSLEQGERYQVKHIVVKPGAILSLQMHRLRSEHWIIVQGTAKVTRGDETFILHENQSIFISVGEKHRVENPGQIPLEIIEVQSGSYFGEDDIVRLADQYGRTAESE